MVFAILHAVQKLDQYLHKSEFVIRTDQKPPKYITGTKEELIMCGYDVVAKQTKDKELL